MSDNEPDKHASNKIKKKRGRPPSSHRGNIPEKLDEFKSIDDKNEHINDKKELSNYQTTQSVNFVNKDVSSHKTSEIPSIIKEFIKLFRVAYIPRGNGDGFPLASIEAATFKKFCKKHEIESDESFLKIDLYE
jgi:hypothetical protein